MKNPHSQRCAGVAGVQASQHSSLAARQDDRARYEKSKRRLAYAPNAIIDAQRLTQAAAAAGLGLNQPKVSVCATTSSKGSR